VCVCERERERERVSSFSCCCLLMEDSKRAAKAFVDQYFPVKEPNPKAGDVFGDLFSPSSKKVSTNKKQAYGDGKFHGSPKKNQSIPQKGGNAAEHCEISEPCLMSSSVDYGCRDNYPYNPDNRYPDPSSYIEKKDRKDGSDYANPEIQGSEFWQGSFYY